MRVVVYNDNVDQAIKVLKKKLQKDGVFRELKLRQYYEKPFERRKREKIESLRRVRKLMGKKTRR